MSQGRRKAAAIERRSFARVPASVGASGLGVVLASSSWGLLLQVVLQLLTASGKH